MRPLLPREGAFFVNSLCGVDCEAGRYGVVFFSIHKLQIFCPDVSIKESFDLLGLFGLCTPSQVTG